jgi:hypothetical protein
MLNLISFPEKQYNTLKEEINELEMWEMTYHSKKW